MSATRLLVLGVVRLHGQAHGYLVGSELESWEAGQWAGLRSGSIYHALRQLAKEGLLDTSEVHEWPGRVAASTTSSSAPTRQPRSLTDRRPLSRATSFSPGAAVAYAGDVTAPQSRGAPPRVWELIDNLVQYAMRPAGPRTIAIGVRRRQAPAAGLVEILARRVRERGHAEHRRAHLPRVLV
ncbi:PadR family transcriptional regulator [Nonomuraea angiospora]|uniref:Transcription regulator PadR N-terminal domain-containing protein n=1 Tax=Nonomuraea angiospora TaxID=46172 RepID=A0ABR9LPJ4_9ACTN|nr:helix-turn-helix transcriptional regulator [Nonomuraea angiospora]MBE1582569.1 hypothetical protein [Nonomuraea angiospora]